MERNLTKKAERIKDKERLSAIVTNKMATVFIALVFAIAVLVRVSSTGATEIGFVKALPFISIGFAVLTVAALIYYVVSERKKVDARYVVFSAPLLLGIFASGLFAALIYTTIGGAFRTVLVLLAFALLFFVYQIFSIDFFACSVAAVTSCVAAALATSAGVPSGFTVLVNIVAVLAGAAACFGGIYFVNRLVKYRRLEICGRKFRKPQNCVPAAVNSVMAVSFAALIFAVATGYLLYAIAVIAVVYIVAAIIYTVKLM